MATLTNRIQRVTAADAKAVHQLRLQVFANARDFTVAAPENLVWSERDSGDIVLAVWHGADPVSTMRGSVLKNSDEAKAEFECSVPASVKFPALLLARGATRGDFQGIGLNSALRYHFLSFTVGTRIQSIVGVVNVGAPRTRVMARLGYEFYLPNMSWGSSLKHNNGVMVAALDYSRIINACSLLERETRQVLAAYPWQGETPRFNV